MQESTDSVQFPSNYQRHFSQNRKFLNLYTNTKHVPNIQNNLEKQTHQHRETNLWLPIVGAAGGA